MDRVLIIASDNNMHDWPHLLPPLVDPVPFGRFPKDAAIVNHVLEFSIYSFPKDVSVNSVEP